MEILPIFVVLILTKVDIGEAVPTVESMNNLRNILLANYSKYTLPSSDFNQQFVVDIRAYPLAVGDIDEIEEELATVLGFDIAWNDTSIKWDPAEHDNITNITLGLNEVWKPYMMLLNPHQKDITGHTDEPATGLTYSYLGSTTWTTMKTLHTTCDIETTYFPFDIQDCVIDFHFMGDETYQMIIHVVWAWYEKENGAWKIVGQNITGSDYSHFWIDFKFQRKPMFMLINILLPLIILAMLTPLVFLMPKSSGERLGYSVTMMLALSVYMTIINEHLPQNSEPMPLISIMIFVWYILNAIIVLVVILNIKVSHIKDSRRIPGCIRCFVRLTRAVSRKKTLSFTGSEEEREQCLKGEDEQEQNGSGCKVKSVKITWMEVSVAVDRWCLFLFYLIKFILPAAFLVVIAK